MLLPATGGICPKKSAVPPRVYQKKKYEAKIEENRWSAGKNAGILTISNMVDTPSRCFRHFAVCSGFFRYTLGTSRLKIGNLSSWPLCRRRRSIKRACCKQPTGRDARKSVAERWAAKRFGTARCANIKKSFYALACTASRRPTPVENVLALRVASGFDQQEITRCQQ